MVVILLPGGPSLPPSLPLPAYLLQVASVGSLYMYNVSNALLGMWPQGVAAVPTVLSVLSMHLTSPPVQNPGCAFLGSLLSMGSAQIVPAIALLTRAAKALPKERVVCEALLQVLALVLL